MECLEDKQRDLVLGSQADRQQVQLELADHWCDMVSSRNIRVEAGSCVLDGLQTTHSDHPGPEQQTVAVIKPTGDKCVNQRASGRDSVSD